MPTGWLIIILGMVAILFAIIARAVMVSIGDIPKRRYEVHPDNTGKFILYEVGDGGFDAVAWFADADDALFAMRAFQDGRPSKTREQR